MQKSTPRSDKWTGAFNALGKILAASLISEVLQQFGKTKKGARKLPPELVAWLVVGMGLFRDLNVSDVLARVSEGLGMRRRGRKRPHATSITQARDRLGWLPVRELFRRLAQQLRDTYVATTKWRELAVYALDGTTFLAADTDSNEHWFGRPSCSKGGGRSAFPSVRALFLVGVWSHLVVDAVFGPYNVSELRLAEYLLDRLEANSLVLLDRAYSGFRWPALFLQRKVHFVIRAKQGKTACRLYKTRCLGRGDWLCRIKPAKKRKKDCALPDSIDVRSVLCKRKGFRPVILITDLLDPKEYPAAEIAGLFRERWEIELTFREFKVHLTHRQAVLRSKKPDRVLQELYGLLIAFNCVRGLMCEAAREVGVRPVRLSFIECLHRTRWTLIAAHDAAAPTAILKRLLASLRECRLPPRRLGRTYMRAIKVKMNTSFPRKRTDAPTAATRHEYAARKRSYYKQDQLI